jgi:hypothetical protein
MSHLSSGNDIPLSEKRILVRFVSIEGRRRRALRRRDPSVPRERKCVVNKGKIHIQKDRALLAGVEKHLSSKGCTVIIDGESYVAADFAKLLDGRIAVAEASAAARAVWQTRVNEERVKERQTRNVVSALRQTVLIMYSSKHDVLTDFGMAPRRARRELTAVEKVEMVKKIKATRAARHTMGKKAKLAIKGVVPPEPAEPAPPAILSATCNEPGRTGAV